MTKIKWTQMILNPFAGSAAGSIPDSATKPRRK